jgi:hypothetical protein
MVVLEMLVVRQRQVQRADEMRPSHPSGSVALIGSKSGVML